MFESESLVSIPYNIVKVSSEDDEFPASNLVRGGQNHQK